MNIRLAPGELRIAVNRTELDQLRARQAIHLELALPRQHAMRVSVTVVAVGDWALDSDPTGLWLAIPLRDLEGFATTPGTEASVVRRFETNDGRPVTLVLQVEEGAGGSRPRHETPQP